jgi:putative membrane protein
MWGSTGMGSGMWIWLLILMGCGMLFFMRWPSMNHYRTHRRYEDPLEVARMRLARGEINSEEFEEIRKTLVS